MTRFTVFGFCDKNMYMKGIQLNKTWSTMNNLW